jgi:hypothetical protein
MMAIAYKNCNPVTMGVFGKFKNTIVSTLSPSAKYPRAPIDIKRIAIVTIPIMTTLLNLSGCFIDSAIGSIKLG